METWRLDCADRVHFCTRKHALYSLTSSRAPSPSHTSTPCPKAGSENVSSHPVPGAAWFFQGHSWATETLGVTPREPLQGASPRSKVQGRLVAEWTGGLVGPQVWRVRLAGPCLGGVTCRIDTDPFILFSHRACPQERWFFHVVRWLKKYQKKNPFMTHEILISET